MLSIQACLLWDNSFRISYTSNIWSTSTAYLNAESINNTSQCKISEDNLNIYDSYVLKF